MTYLSRDKRNGGGSFWRLLATALCILFLIFILILPHFFAGFFQTIGRPFWQIKNNISASSFFSGFSSNKKLSEENRQLEDKLNQIQASDLNIQTLTNENASLKEILGRKDPKSFLILGNILVRPPESPYDTFILDIGSDHGVKVGEKVLALGNIAIGDVVEIQKNTSSVKLFSSSGSKNQVLIQSGTSTISAAATGKGGGNFEITLPVGSEVAVGNPVVLSDGKSTLLGYIESVDAPANAAFLTVLLKSPVNAEALYYLEIMAE